MHTRVHKYKFIRIRPLEHFIDWLTVHQDYPEPLPILGDRACVWFDAVTNEYLHLTSPSYKHEGSFSTSIQIKVSGNRLTISGNPSRIDRQENLFGFKTIDDCILVYNRILLTYGLPPLTKCTKVWHGTPDKKGKFQTFTDGAVIQEIHITSNKSVGHRLEDDYIKGISTLSFRNSNPRLHANGKTCDWLTKAGKGGRLIYPSVYNKGFELRLHSLPKILRKFGADSDEYRYLLQVIEYCEQHGVCRFELKIKSEFLSRENCRYYGLFDTYIFKNLIKDFCALDGKLQVESMNIETITSRLIREGVCSDVRAANTTSLYAINWMHGHVYDLSKKQAQTHRARLRKIGIDIARPCDHSKFSLVNVVSTQTIFTRTLDVPEWYQLPAANSHLSLVRN